MTIIIAQNEERHIQRCVSHLKGWSDVLVLDGGSVDATVNLAQEAGARVVDSPWPGFAAQRNIALEIAAADYQADWVVMIDADEYVQRDFVQELRHRLEGATEAAFWVPRQNYHRGHALRYAGRWPDLQLRVLRPERSRYQDVAVHEHPTVEGVAGRLSSPIHHESLETTHELMQKHYRYAELEVAGSRSVDTPAMTDLFSRDRRVRRAALKHRVWFRLPSRPAIRWIWLILVKGGFRDGRAGFAYATLLFWYELTIDMLRSDIAEVPEGDDE